MGNKKNDNDEGRTFLRAYSFFCQIEALLEELRKIDIPIIDKTPRYKAFLLTKRYNEIFQNVKKTLKADPFFAEDIKGMGILRQPKTTFFDHLARRNDVILCLSKLKGVLKAFLTLRMPKEDKQRIGF